MFKQKKITDFAPSSTGVDEGAKVFTKKFFVIIAVIVLLVCSFCIPVSGASSVAEVTDYSVKSVSNYYGEMEYSVKIIGDGFYTSGFVCDFVQYDMKTEYNAYNIFMDFPTTFAVREVITVSGALIVPANTTSVKIAFGGFANYELFDTSICTKMYAEDTFDYYLPFSYSFKVSTASIDKLNRVYFTISGSSNLWGFGISNIKFESKTDVNDAVSGATNNIVNNQNNNTNSIINNQNSNASDIQENQDKNTQEIIDNQNQIVENEKTETENSGNDGVGELTEAIPDYSGSLITAITKLTSNMIHSNLTCNINFPNITIPSMKLSILGTNLNTPAITFQTKKTYDLSTYVTNLIPSTIMIVVQNILSIALYIYCIKEFYGIIEYVMTLGGNKNE